MASGAPAPPRGLEPYDGVLVVDKPAGPTSHDVVDRIRRTFQIRKVGHGGTLDPQATGLLIVLVGRGTKLSSLFLGSDKTYEGTLRLGVATDSQDAQGRVTAERDPSGVTRDRLEAEMARFRGDLYQTPPMVSAVKVDGVPLYKRARRGQTVKREPRLVHVYAFDLTDFRPPYADFVLRCSKGTYARTLCADVGEALGCGAHLHALRRTRSGDIDIAAAVPLDALLELSREALYERILPMHRFTRR
ncbi:MAG: tRNA pseudouridine(55) synthase TruB [Lentisphaerae bacterium]|nr:tRNA pseudouridine(55) synthase TruB [Lentisphaerota bacterium]